MSCCCRDIVVIIAVSILWSILGAVTVFGFLSFYAQDMGVVVQDVLDTGESAPLILLYRHARLFFRFYYDFN